jgi:hypothetical protein
MPGPKTQRCKSIACGCTQAEYESIHAAAHARGVRAGTYIRLLALAQPVPKRAEALPPAMDVEAVKHLAAMRALLNQIARARNRDHALTVEQYRTVTEFSESLSAVLAALRARGAVGSDPLQPAPALVTVPASGP